MSADSIEKSHVFLGKKTKVPIDQSSQRPIELDLFSFYKTSYNWNQHEQIIGHPIGQNSLKRQKSRRE